MQLKILRRLSIDDNAPWYETSNQSQIVEKFYLKSANYNIKPLTITTDGQSTGFKPGALVKTQ